MGARRNIETAIRRLVIVQGTLLWIASFSAAQPQPKEPPRLPQAGPNTGAQPDVLLPVDPQTLRSVQQQLQQARAAPYNTSFAQDLSVEEKASLDLLLQANQDPNIFDRGEGALQQHVATSFAQASSPVGGTAMAPAVPAVALARAPGASATAGGSAPSTTASGAGGGGAGVGRNGSSAIAPAPAGPTILNRQTESDIINQLVNRTYNPLSMQIGSAVGTQPSPALLTTSSVWDEEGNDSIYAMKNTMLPSHGMQ